jgi:hypothetical protein
MCGGPPSLFALALIAPDSRHPQWRSQLPGFGLLLACYRECVIKICFCHLLDLARAT